MNGVLGVLVAEPATQESAADNVNALGKKTINPIVVSFLLHRCVICEVFLLELLSNV